jgi:ribose-phosphate pyrophosphokinase
MIKLKLVSHNGRGMTPREWTTIDAPVFKGGEVNPCLHIDIINALPYAANVTLKTYLNDPATGFELMLVVDAIRQINPEVKLFLEMGYTPYARQDRVCNPGEANGIAVFARVLNMLKFNEVRILDPHSDVAPAVINNSVIRSLAEVIQIVQDYNPENIKDTYLVAPDAGAQKRVKALAKELGAAGYIFATKERDLETMEITGTRFDSDTTGKKLLVVDDICDGGRTFIALAKAIREHGEPAKLELWVTHGIFSYGTEVVTEHYDAVTSTNTFQPYALGNKDNAGNVNPKMNWLNI